jgi:hypothetical protein
LRASANRHQWSIVERVNETDAARNNLAVALLYENSETITIATNITQISADDSDSITAAHLNNMVEATAQAQFCAYWEGPAVETEQRMVVSGVWYPKTRPRSGTKTFSTISGLIHPNIPL